MKIIIGIETQPSFPLEDLSDKNAETLELLLSNKLIVSEFHDVAEKSAWAFKVGHPATTHCAGRLYDGAYIEAVSHGAAVLEAMNTAVVGVAASEADMFRVNSSAHDLISHASEGRLRGHSLAALDDFRDQMPLTAEVVGSASRRFFGALTDYAILGAALERRIVVDSVVFS